MGDKTQLIWAARIFQLSGRFHLGDSIGRLPPGQSPPKARDVTVARKICGALLRALRCARDRCTLFPLPLYVTLNDQARGAESPEARLRVLLAEAGLSDSRDFLHRLLTARKCIFLLDALDEVVDDDARNRIVDWIGQTRIRGRNTASLTCWSVRLCKIRPLPDTMVGSF